ncbi:MAG: hypothetical protein R3Y60_02345 [bacterium]
MKRLLATICTLGAAFSLTGCFSYTPTAVPATTEQQEQLDDFVFWMTDDALNTTMTMIMDDAGEEVTYTMAIDGNLTRVDIKSSSKDETYYEEFKDGKSIQYYYKDDAWSFEEFDTDGSTLKDSMIFNMDYLVAEDFIFTGEYWHLEVKETVDDQSFTYICKVEFDEYNNPTLTLSTAFLFMTYEYMTISFSNTGTTTVVLPTI